MTGAAPRPDVRALLWPQARAGSLPVPAGGRAGLGQAQGASPAIFDAARFAAGFAPDAATRLGFRLSLRAAINPPETGARLVRITGCDIEDGKAWLELEAGLADALLSRLFGAPPVRKAATPGPGTPAASAASLPSAASSSWQSLAQLLGHGLRAGLAAAGIAPGPMRPVDQPEVQSAPSARSVWLTADAGGGPGWLAISAELAPGRTTPGATPRGENAAPAARGQAPTAWQQRAAALARAIEVPAGVRIAECRLPLAEVAALEVGALVPIEKPARLLLSVDGQAWKTLPAPQPGHGEQGLADPAGRDQEGGPLA
jgi:flagellar motor switch/type III secretory pathway protein FliN